MIDETNNTNERQRTSSRLSLGQLRVMRSVLSAMLIAQAIMLAWSALRHSPGLDEPGHLASGLNHWETGTFDAYRVNPPLVRMVASAPLAAAGVQVGSHPWEVESPIRVEFALGRKLFSESGDRAFWYVSLARWACIPFTLVATVVIYRWATTLYGHAGGVLSAFLWTVCPNALAHGQMITPDAGAASAGILAAYLFWRWLVLPGWAGAVRFGFALGLALLCKNTLLLFVPLWPIMWLAYRFRNPAKATFRITGWRGQSLQLAVGLILAFYVLAAGYGFERMGRRLGEIRFVSESLTVEGPSGRINRFAGTRLGQLPLPVPENYVRGIDVQKSDFESCRRSYLRGEWQAHGWYHYYLWGLLVKTPVGTLIVLALSIAVSAFSRLPCPGWRDELLVLIPGLGILGFVSSQTGLNHHLRYVLPTIPFFYVLAGRAVTFNGAGRRWWRLGTAVAAIIAAVGSLSVYPHSLSFFNTIVGGPRRGSEHLVDSNIDWGQDLLHLKEWYDSHPEARPFHLAYFGAVDPRAAGIQFVLPPKGPVLSSDFSLPRSARVGPRPGWYAISVNFLRGYRHYAANGAGGREFLDQAYYAYFQRARPVGHAGYSIYVYHLDEAECARLRTELGLPPLAD